MSVIIPVLQEAKWVGALTEVVRPLLGAHEVVIVDGGSNDGTFELLQQKNLGTVIQAKRGRAAQMNAGAKVACGHALLFLHADTVLPEGAIDDALLALERGADGGCFGVEFDSSNRLLRAAAFLQTWRTRVLKSGTGDQAFFVRSDVFEELSGFSESWPVCEDLDFVRRFWQARGKAHFASVPSRVTTSARRWKRFGVARTTLVMWGVRLGYHLGLPPEDLAEYYDPNSDY